MEELTWTRIPGFQDYEAHPDGSIRNAVTLQVLTPRTNKAGYAKVSVQNANRMHKTPAVHQLIATTFIPNPENKATVGHLNHDRGDNRLFNLEWQTVREQNNDRIYQNMGPSTRAVWKCDRTSGERIERFESIKSALASFGRRKGDISVVASRSLNKRGQITPTAFGYKWEYESLEIEGEEWKLIDPQLVKGVEGFVISTKGRIMNPKGRVTLPFDVGSDGYVGFSILNNQYLAHVLIAKVFCPNPDSKNIVNHKDGNKQNCHVDNLEWCTRSENCKHAFDTGLNPWAKRICQFTLKGVFVREFPSAARACEITGISRGNISSVANGRARSAGGFDWRFKE